MGFICGQNRRSWVVIHARSQAIGRSASFPAEGVSDNVAGLGCEEPLDVQLEVVVDDAEELDKLIVRLRLQLWIGVISIEQVA